MIVNITNILLYLLEISIVIVADPSLHGKVYKQKRNHTTSKSGNTKPYDNKITITYSQTALSSLQEHHNVTSGISYIDARRFNSFSNPANLQDPKFQELLNKYRGMVQKNQEPHNDQQFPPVQSFQRPQNPYVPNGQAVTFQFQYTKAGQKEGAQFPEYYGLPEQYDRKKYLIDNIYKRWQSPLTQPARQTTPLPAQLPRYSSMLGLIKGHHPQWGRGVGRQRPPPTPPGTGRTPGERFDQPEAGGGGGGPTAPVYTKAPNQVTTTVNIGGQGNAGAGAATRFTTRTTTTRKRRRTTPPRVSFEEDCDYIAYYCLKAYDTGQICGRTMYNLYSTFQNYCMLDFVNCMERYEVWQIVHMGECFELKILSEYLHYPYLDDYFLDQYYIIEDV